MWWSSRPIRRLGLEKTVSPDDVFQCMAEGNLEPLRPLLPDEIASFITTCLKRKVDNRSVVHLLEGTVEGRTIRPEMYGALDGKIAQPHLEVGVDGIFPFSHKTRSLKPSFLELSMHPHHQ